MRVEAPVAGAKGLMQRVDAKIRATLPRQARVTRTEGKSVWVKFLGDGANDPESKFPSTVAGVPVATMGWVITLGGKKGLFVATGLSELPPSPHNHDGRYYTEAEVDALLPQTKASPFATGTLPVSSAGYYAISNATVTFTGLQPSAMYTVRTDISVMAGTEGRMAVIANVSGSGVTRTTGFQQDLRATNNQRFDDSGVLTVQASAGGVIVVSAECQWVSGSFTVWGGRVVATIQKA